MQIHAHADAHTCHAHTSTQTSTPSPTRAGATYTQHTRNNTYQQSPGVDEQHSLAPPGLWLLPHAFQQAVQGLSTVHRVQHNARCLSNIQHSLELRLLADGVPRTLGLDGGEGVLGSCGSGRDKFVRSGNSKGNGCRSMLPPNTHACKQTTTNCPPQFVDFMLCPA